MAENKGIVLILSGPTGVGKDEIAKILIKNYGFFQLPSNTTRPKRQDDKPGDYNYLTEEEYFEFLKNNKFINSKPIKYTGNYYGLKTDDLKNIIHEGKNVVMNLIGKTPFLIKNMFPHNAVLIYLLPDSMNNLLKRLEKRNMEDAEIKKRLEEDSRNLKYLFRYDKIIINKQGSPYTTAAEIFEYLENLCLDFPYLFAESQSH